MCLPLILVALRNNQLLKMSKFADNAVHTCTLWILIIDRRCLSLAAITVDTRTPLLGVLFFYLSVCLVLGRTSPFNGAVVIVFCWLSDFVEWLLVAVVQRAPNCNSEMEILLTQYRCRGGLFQIGCSLLLEWFQCFVMSLVSMWVQWLTDLVANDQ